MNRQEFMGQLNRLLAEVPEDERQDALAYYEDYFDAAGPEQEDQVIQDLGSPGKVAAIIRADLREGSRTRGEFTENGYQDDRFSERRQTPARRGESREKGSGSAEKNAWTKESQTGENAGEGHGEPFRKNIWQQRREAWRNQNDNGGSGQGQDRSWQEQEERRARRQPQGLGRWVWLLLLICVAGPVVLGIGGVILGLLGGFLAAALGIALSGIVLLGSGVYHAVIGAMKIAASPASGLVGLGVGLLAVGLGILIFLLCVWLAFRIFPRCFRWVVNAIRGIFRHGGRRDGEEV